MIRDNSSQLPSPVIFPPKGGKYIDPKFGTEITRLTDETDSNGINSHAYSSRPYSPLSVDGKHLILGINGKPYLDDFDCSTLTSTNRRKLLASYTGTSIEWTSIVWSLVEPNRCFFVEPGKQNIWEHDVVRDSYGVVKRFNDPALKIASIWGLSVSDDANLFAFRATLTDGSSHAAVYWRSINHVEVFPSAIVHAVVVSPNGRILRILDSDQMATFYDLYADTISPPIGNGIGIPASDPWGYLNHLDWNREWMVGGKAVENGIAARRFEKPTTGQLFWKPELRPDGSVDWYAHHVSLAGNFFVFSSYNCDRSWRAFQEEIVQFYFDPRTGTPLKYRRLAHSQSYGAGGNVSVKGNYTGDIDYFRQPRACVCEVLINGEVQHIVFWTSDLGMSGNRTDVLCTKISATDETLDLQEDLAISERSLTDTQNQLGDSEQAFLSQADEMSGLVQQNTILINKIAAAKRDLE